MDWYQLIGFRIYYFHNGEMGQRRRMGVAFFNKFFFDNSFKITQNLCKDYRGCPNAHSVSPILDISFYYSINVTLSQLRIPVSPLLLFKIYSDFLSLYLTSP
jgi:hypothetical protein